MALTGTVRPHRRGFGFINLAEPTDGPNGAVDSLFVPPPALVDLLDGDEVACQAVDDGRGKGLTAEDVVLLRRTRRLLAGLLLERQGRLVLRPDPSLASRDWVIPDDALPPGAKAGQGCVLTIAEAALDGSLRRCGDLVAGPVEASSWRWLRLLAATRHLGVIDRSDPALAAGADDALASDLSADPGAEVGVPLDEPEPGDDPLAGVRVDLTDEPCCTIDGPDTRDLDDAVHAVRLDGGATRISVHIADAAAAVTPASGLDRRARIRATTTYLPSGTWPMLPRSLSEGALSLRAKQRRRAVTVAFTVDAGGDLADIEVTATAVRSGARLTYAQVEGWLTGESAQGADDGWEVTPDVEVAAEVRDAVFAAHEAAERIGAARLARGAGSGGLFSEAEARPAVDGDRVTLQRRVPTPLASRLVERLMVAANEAVAGWLLGHGAPALYRVQPAPDPERLQQLVGLLATVGLAADVEALADPSATEALVDAAADAGLERSVVAGLVAQGMQRAGYETDPGSHFGLASRAYVHFTSPIRRYADLVVHRAVHGVLLGGGTPGDAFPPEASLEHGATTAETPPEPGTSPPTAPPGPSASRSEGPLGPSADDLGRLAGWLDHRAGAATRAERAELRLLWADVLQRTVAGGRPYTTTALIGAVRRAGLRIRVDRFDLVGTVPIEALAPGNKEAYVQATDELSATVGDTTYHVGDRIRVAVQEADRATGDLTFAPAPS